jgi:mRNA interferase MazF
VAASPERGEIWSANLNPIRGHEQAGTRPVLVVSTDMYNRGPAGLIIVVPMTRTDRHIPIHVVIEPPEGGVTARTVLLCDAVRSVSTDRLVGEPWGGVTPAALRAVEDRLRLLMDL